MDKFICAKCGSCCKSFQENQEILSLKGNLIELSPPSLFIFDWEKKYFPENSLQPGTCVFDLKNETLIVLNYALKHRICPNLKNNICTIYGYRPLSCRIYPCPLHDIEKTNYVQSAFGLCKAEIPVKELISQLSTSTKDEARIKLYTRYGDSFVYGIIYNILLENYSKFLSELEKNNIAKFAKEGYALESLKKRTGHAKVIGISDLYFEFHKKHLHTTLLSEKAIALLKDKFMSAV